jgi:hypothetical protein
MNVIGNTIETVHYVRLNKGENCGSEIGVVKGSVLLGCDNVLFSKQFSTIQRTILPLFSELSSYKDNT